jgi:hypothetical protein
MSLRVPTNLLHATFRLGHKMHNPCPRQIPCRHAELPKAVHELKIFTEPAPAEGRVETQANVEATRPSQGIRGTRPVCPEEALAFA